MFNQRPNNNPMYMNNSNSKLDNQGRNNRNDNMNDMNNNNNYNNFNNMYNNNMGNMNNNNMNNMNNNNMDNNNNCNMNNINMNNMYNNNNNMYNNNMNNQNSFLNQMNNENKNYKRNLQLINVGNSMKSYEVDVIITCACHALNKEEDPLSKGIIKRIKEIIGGEWVVFAYIDGLKGYDLSVSIDDGNKIVSLVVDNFWFQIIKLSN